jgi:hypothetical protein
MSTICMKLDPGMHIGMHLVCFSKTRCDRKFHRPVAEELVGRPREGGAREDPQGSLGSAEASPRSRGHLV